MPLTKTDLTQIKEVVTEVVTTEIAKSEKRIRTELIQEINSGLTKLGGKITGIEQDITGIKANTKDINRNLDDMIETNQRFLEILGNHDQRITRLETKPVRRSR